MSRALKPDPYVLTGQRACPETDQHTPRPSTGFSAWAREQERTHRITQCTGCGCWVNWVPRA